MQPEEFARLLKGRRIGNRKWLAKCPAHDDRKASLSITATEGGARLHCFTGCHQTDVLAAMGLTWRDTLRETETNSKLWHQAKRIREEEDRKRLRVRRTVRTLIAMASVFQTVSDRLVERMVAEPENEAISPLYHRSMASFRSLEALVDHLDSSYCRGLGVPRWNKRIPAWLVGPEIAELLRKGDPCQNTTQKTQ